MPFNKYEKKRRMFHPCQGDTSFRCVNDDVFCSLIFQVITYPLVLFCFVLIGNLALCTVLCLYKMQVRCLNIFQYVLRFWRETRAYGCVRCAARCESCDVFAHYGEKQFEAAAPASHFSLLLLHFATINNLSNYMSKFQLLDAIED